MVFGINLGQKKRVFGYFSPRGRKLAIFKKMGILGSKKGHFEVNFRPFWSISDFFDHKKIKVIKTHSEPFLHVFGPILTRFGPFWGYFGAILGHFGPFWSILTKLISTHKKVFKTNLDRFEVILDRFGPFSPKNSHFDPFWAQKQPFRASLANRAQ